MTRKHYIAIAAAIRAEVGNFPTKGGPEFYRIADKLADVMADDNPRFDRERFLRACGVTQ